MTTTILIDGGYGRCVASTGVITEFKKRNPDEVVNIVTSFPEIFINNPHINKVYSVNHEYLYEDHIQGTEYKQPEPYKLQKYLTGELHMVNGFALEILGEDKFYNPELYLSESDIEEAKVFVSKSEKPIILFQPFGASGGQTKDGKKILNDSSFRSLPFDFAKKLHDKLSEKYQVIIVKTPDQASIEGSMILPTMPMRKIAALFPHVKGVICIDSSVQHICAALGKKSIVLWGSTNKKQLGYESAVNLGASQHIIQYNPVRVPGNDYDSEKRYKNVWNYLNDSVINKISEELEAE